MLKIGESQQLKEIFSRYIPGNLLIDVLENYIFKHEENLRELARIFNLPSLDLSGTTAVYVSAKLVAANHHANMLTKGNIEKMRLSKKEEYKNELARSVMEQIRIAPYNLQGLENTNVFLDEPYIAPAVILANVLVHAIAENKELSLKKLKQNHIALTLIYEGCKSVISTMVLFQLGSYTQAISVYRNLLEEMVKLQIIELYPESIKSYERFCEYNIAYQNERPSKEFEKEFAEKKIRKAWTQNFLMYGWLDSIAIYNHNYSFKSATELFSDGAYIYKLYEYSSRFTHSTHIGLDYNWENLKYYFSLNTLSILKFLVETYHKYAGSNQDELNGVDLYKALIDGGNRLHQIVTYLNELQKKKR